MADPNFQSRLHDLFAEAVGLPAVDRVGFLNRSCDGDPALRTAVEDLLAALESAGDFMADPVVPKDRLPESAEPTRIGPYALRGIIGEGGYGTVYLAEQDPPLQRLVAIKVIRAGMDTAATVARFELERQSLARMEHPNIARVFDAGSTPQGRPYFAMERVEGPPISDYCVENKLGLIARLQLLGDVCAAVQHAHQKGIVHRDLKPTNVLVAVHDQRPVPKVIDFGIAIAIVGETTASDDPGTGTLRLLGTPGYSSPEQLSLGADDVDTRADVYGLGMILYELLTDTPAFDAVRLRTATDRDFARTIREVAPPVPSLLPAKSMGPTVRLRSGLDRVVMKAIEKDRARRYATVEAFAADLQRYLRCEPVEAGRSTKVDRCGLFVRRHARLVATGCVVAVLLTAAGVLTATEMVAARTGRDRAQAAELRTERARQQADTDRDRAIAAESAATIERQQAEADRDRAIAAEQSGDTARKLADENASRVFSAQQFIYLLVSDPDRPVSPSLLNTLAARSRDSLLTSHPETLSTLHLALGNAYLRAKMVDPAAEQFRAYLDNSPPEKTPNDLINEAAALHNLGLTMLAKDDYVGSRPLFRHALDVFYKATDGKDDLRDASLLGDLGITMANAGELTEAEPLLRRSVEVFKQVDRPGEHLEWSSMEELAQVLDGLNRHAEAKVLWDEAMPHDPHKRSSVTHRIVDAAPTRP